MLEQVRRVVGARRLGAALAGVVFDALLDADAAALPAAIALYAPAFQFVRPRAGRREEGG
jgi:hypothetical protein